jgi:DNA-directed RNA polymerase subunit beta
MQLFIIPYKKILLILKKKLLNIFISQLRNAEPPDEETARGIIDKLFFSDQRYNLGEVGRYRMNKKLGLM